MLPFENIVKTVIVWVFFFGANVTGTEKIETYHSNTLCPYHGLK